MKIPNLNHISNHTYLNLKKETQIITQIKHQQFDLAVAAISESYHELLYWHIRKLVKHHDDANDALQNTYVERGFIKA